jgi:hypothetical protein
MRLEIVQWWARRWALHSPRREVDPAAFRRKEDAPAMIPSVHPLFEPAISSSIELNGA